MMYRRFLKWMLLTLLAPAAMASEIFVHPDKPLYTKAPGARVDVIITLSAPIPHGLEGYHLRLRHPANLFSERLILVETPDLDNGWFEGPAERHFDDDSARIQGFVAWGAPAYPGTSFLVFRLTVAPDTPPGDYFLELEFPEDHCFINGRLEYIDDNLDLGSAILRVTGIVDLNGNGVPDDWELQFFETLDDVPDTVMIRGHNLTILQMYIAGLDPTGDRIPAFDSPSSFFAAPGRLYDIYRSADLMDPDGWTLISTLSGTGASLTIPDSGPGFYRFSVRLPAED